MSYGLSVAKSSKEPAQGGPAPRDRQTADHRRGPVPSATRGSAAVSAPIGLTRPEPKLSSRAPAPSRRALVVRMRRMSAGLSRELRTQVGVAAGLNLAR